MYSDFNAASMGLANKLTSEIKAAIPELHSYQVNFRKPEIVKNCPDNLHDYVEMLRQRAPLLVDNEPFTWDGHEYLIDPYKDLAVTGDKSEEGDNFVWMCGAQVGKSVGAMLFEQFLAIRFWGKYHGYFLPTDDMAMIFSGQRFKPMCMAIPDIAAIWGEDPTADDSSKKKGDMKRVRSIGPSLIFFQFMGGKTSTESIPMLSLSFDEVRRMLDADIERAQERISHSPYPLTFKISTAGYPEANIDRAFRNSNQHKFHSECRCPDGVVLSDMWPDCVGEVLPGVTPSLKGLGRYFWVCPRCKEPIPNSRVGRWIAHNPQNRTVGYHIAQTLSCRQSAAKIYKAFLEATDITEFYNSKLGIPHISKDSQIVNKDILEATVNTDLKWEDRGMNCAMGIDQMFGLNVIVIRRRGKKDEATGLFKSILVHLEWIVDDDPWKRCDELMEQYDISICVADALPNANEAARFAKRHRGKVFLADYSYEAQGGNDLCVWGDRVVDDHNKRAADETKEKRRVRISRYHAIEWNLKRYVGRLKSQPHPRGIVQDMPNKANQMIPTFIGEVFWDHLQKVARRKHVLDEAQDKFKMVFENIGIDPHFLHADLYCELGLSRLPDPDSLAFSSDRKEEERKSLDGNHNWTPMEGYKDRFYCPDCSVAVKCKEGESPQEVANKHGWKDCQPTSQ